jgi:hypothetical protein
MLIGGGDFIRPHHKRSILQLVVFRHLAQHLQQGSRTGTIEMYAQDPNHDNPHYQVLEALDIQPLADPEAQEISGPQTFVMGPYCTVEAEFVAQCPHRQPALYCGIPPEKLLFRDTTLHLHNAQLDMADDSLPADVIAPANHLYKGLTERLEMIKAFDHRHTQVELPDCDLRFPVTGNLAWDHMPEMKFHFPRRDAASGHD